MHHATFQYYRTSDSSWSSDQEQLYKLFSPLSWNLALIGNAVLEKNMFKICYKHVYSPKARLNNPLVSDFIYIYCRFGNARENLIFANICEFVALRNQSSR